MLPLHDGKTIEEIINRIARFEVIEQRLHGDTRPGKTGRAAHHLSVLSNEFAFHVCNIQHVDIISKRDSDFAYMNPYPIQLEISGPTALWTRPDTGSSPVSYIAPTFSAVKGIFESVLRWKSVNVLPTRCEICGPVQFHRDAFKFSDTQRKIDQIRNGSSFQILPRRSSTSATGSTLMWNGIAGQTTAD